MYTYFDNTKKVLCVIQIVEDNNASETTWKSVMSHTDKEAFEPYDEVTTKNDKYYIDSVVGTETATDNE
jgi:hypothetical protein